MVNNWLGKLFENYILSIAAQKRLGTTKMTSSKLTVNLAHFISVTILHGGCLECTERIRLVKVGQLNLVKLKIKEQNCSCWFALCSLHCPFNRVIPSLKHEFIIIYKIITGQTYIVWDLASSHCLRSPRAQPKPQESKWIQVNHFEPLLSWYTLQ